MMTIQTLTSRCCVVIGTILSLAMAQVCLAHGTGYRILAASQPVCVMFYYSGGAPISYAEIKLFGPDADEVEFQNGRTDANGCFSFLPDRPGQWRMEVSDGRGHAVRASVKVTQSSVTDLRSGKHGPMTPAWQDILLGLSLMANLWIGISVVWTKYRQKNSQKPSLVQRAKRENINRNE